MDLKDAKLRIVLSLVLKNEISALGGNFTGFHRSRGICPLVPQGCPKEAASTAADSMTYMSPKK